MAGIRIPPAMPPTPAPPAREVPSIMLTIHQAGQQIFEDAHPSQLKFVLPVRPFIYRMLLEHQAPL